VYSQGRDVVRVWLGDASPGMSRLDLAVCGFSGKER